MGKGERIMSYVIINLLEKKEDVYIYEFLPENKNEGRGVISMNIKTGEPNIIEKGSSWHRGQAFSALRKFFEEGEFKKTGGRAWGQFTNVNKVESRDINLY